MFPKGRFGPSPAGITQLTHPGPGEGLSPRSQLRCPLRPRDGAVRSAAEHPRVQACGALAADSRTPGLPAGTPRQIFPVRFPPPSGRGTPGLGRVLAETSLRLISSRSVTHQLLISYLSVTISSVGQEISPRARGVGTRGTAGPGLAGGGEKGRVLTALGLKPQKPGFESP